MPPLITITHHHQSAKETNTKRNSSEEKLQDLTKESEDLTTDIFLLYKNGKEKKNLSLNLLTYLLHPAHPEVEVVMRLNSHTPEE